MKLTKNKIIASVFIVAVLIIAYFGIGSPGNHEKLSGTAMEDAVNVSADPTPDNKAEETANPESSMQQEATVQPSAEAEPSNSPDALITPEPSLTPTPESKDSDQQTVKPEKDVNPTKKPLQPVSTKSPEPSMSVNPETGKDLYLTDPVPSGKPLPEEPQDAVVTDKKMTAYLSVSVETILDNLDKLDPEKLELVPKDGIIFAKQEVTFYEGESVFNVLQREMKKHKIHLEFENTPMYNSAYIEGINNLYEFDCGELSGWMYKVDGWFPNYGSSRYKLKQGDVIEWVYTCDLGRDVGDTYNAAGNDAS
ncbi:DUF4430 domain-containing protein [Paenibacillus glycanilyticus]|uniref:DUF4430 domain-containing protein n=1 Tax=Paenibacillus glycanilyticus TaxID=126569 RepID=UPI000FD8AF47|nr:DUF4430 domain-containing protein [Paenibacillus glycanilyticus]